jgi:hypothetical protein
LPSTRAAISGIGQALLDPILYARHIGDRRMVTIAWLNIRLLVDWKRPRATMNRAITALVHFVPAGMLVLAVGRWPYNYYILLRLIVFAAGLLLAWLIYQRVKSFTIWTGLFLIIAIVFNPIVPLHITRGVWSILNLAGAALFAVHFLYDASVIRRSTS